MTDRKVPAMPPDPDQLAAEQLAAWIIESRVLLNAVMVLRTMGDRGQVALDAVLAVRELVTLGAGLQFWELLSQEEGIDPIERLAPHLPEELLHSVRHALWGEDSLGDDPLGI